MITGMSTVFAILIAVVLLGNLIVIVTNKFSKTPESSKNQEPDSAEIAPNTIAAIISAVEVVTLGKGKATSITKVND